MSRPDRPTTNGQSHDIRAVLEAEERARESVEAARAEADVLLEEAETTSRRLERTADDRIRRFHEAGRRLEERHTRQIRGNFEERRRRAEREIPDESRWTAAVEHLARRLAGCDREEDR